jgi:hypothetical protein
MAIPSCFIKQALNIKGAQTVVILPGCHKISPEGVLETRFEEVAI